jgi:hypothetical protein
MEFHSREREREREREEREREREREKVAKKGRTFSDVLI